MSDDEEQRIEEPRKVILDFLSYLEKETQIRFKHSTLSGTWKLVTSEFEESKLRVCLPAEFYSLTLKNFPLVMEMRFCPCGNCNMITYVSIYYKGIDNEPYAMLVTNLMKKVLPDMKFYKHNFEEYA